MEVLAKAEVLPAICQLIIDVPISSYMDASQEASAMEALVMPIHSGKYVLLNIDTLTSYTGLRLYFLNVRDEQCVDKFLCE